MKELAHIIQGGPIFRKISEERISEHFKNIHFQIKRFKKGEMVAQAGDTVEHLIIVSIGSVKGEMIDFSGKVIKIEDIESPRPIAISFIFGQDNKFPVNVTANNDCELLFIPKESLMKLFTLEPQLLENFLNIVSSRSQFLTNKIKLLSFKTIKGKIANFILRQSKGEDKVQLSISQKEMAELFGVARPSLARAMKELEEEGIITAERRDITIINKAGLKGYME